MKRHIVIRILSLLISLVLVSSVVFLFSSFSEGDSSAYILSESSSSENIESYRENAGLGDSTIKRYFAFLASFFSGDFGESISGYPIKDAIVQRLPVSLFLMFFSIIIALLIALPLSYISLRQTSLRSKAVAAFAVISASFPLFLIAMLSVLLFSVKLQLFPAAGLASGFSSFILPSLSLGVVYSSLFIRVLRRKLREFLSSPAGFYALSAGMSMEEAAFVIGTRPAIPLLAAVIGESAVSILGGSAIIETVFALPGLGSLLVKAALERDAMLSGAAVAVIVIITGAISIISEIVIRVSDPRSRK